jgi:hypothetical protein
MSHKITVTCHHDDGGGLGLAVLVAAVLLLAGSGGAVASFAHALLVAVIAVAIGLAVLAAAMVTVMVLVRRRRRARWLAEPIPAPPWHPAVAMRPARAALPPAGPAARRAVAQLPAPKVIPGRAEPVPAPELGEARRARRRP